jgi:hypothetical protein
MTLPGLAFLLGLTSLGAGVLLGAPFSILAGLGAVLVALYEGREPE